MIKNNTHIIFIVLGFMCLIGIFFGIRSYVQWKGSYYFGQVTSVTEGGFTFSGLRSREYVVDVTESTIIKKGFGVLTDSVSVNDRVMVIGKVGDNSHIDVSLVRIMGRRSNSGQ